MSCKTITVTPPINLTKEENNLLFPNLNYQITTKEVKSYNNAFIARQGIVLQRLTLIKASVFYSKHLLFMYYKLALGNYFLRKKKRLKNEQKYLIIHNIWCNGYYHWICDALPRLWCVKNNSCDYILLLPDTYKKSQLESLKAFAVKDIIFIDKSFNYIVHELILPANPGKVYEPDPEICAALRDHFHNHLSKELLDSFDFGERIFISRSKAKNRKVENEPELNLLLEQYNFRTVAFEDYTFWEQVAIMYHTKYLISIHGAGLTNMHFMKEGGTILELYKERVPKVDYGRVRQNDLPSPCYCRLASALKHKHYIQFCTAVDPNVPAGSANIVVDKINFEKNLQELILN